jgi:hypothetical protein
MSGSCTHFDQVAVAPRSGCCEDRLRVGGERVAVTAAAGGIS